MDLFLVSDLIDAKVHLETLRNWKQDGPLPGWAGDLQCGSWRQLFLKFAISHPAVVCAFVPMMTVPQIREVMEAARGPMPDEKLRIRIVEELKA